jgi:hypothetical protein
MESQKITFAIPVKSNRDSFVKALEEAINRELQSTSDIENHDVDWKIEPVEGVGKFGGSDVLIIAVIYALTHPEKIEKWAQIISKSYRWLKKHWGNVDIEDKGDLDI